MLECVCYLFSIIAFPNLSNPSVLVAPCIWTTKYGDQFSKNSTPLNKEQKSIQSMHSIQSSESQTVRKRICGWRREGWGDGIYMASFNFCKLLQKLAAEPSKAQFVLLQSNGLFKFQFNNNEKKNADPIIICFCGNNCSKTPKQTNTPNSKVCSVVLISFAVV